MSDSPQQLVDRLLRSDLTADEATTAFGTLELDHLMAAAAEQRDAGWGERVSYSRKVFLPLTHLCRDICHYCVFAQAPKPGEPAYLTPEQLLAIARPAAAAGCKEALFTLGDKPELRWKAAREGLAALGHDTTLGYLAEAADLVFRETGLLPHLNPGLMTADDFARLRPLSPSMGIMLESVSERLHEKGNAHYGCPDKLPAPRIETLRLAGEARVPFTSGLLIGIGETRAERIEALLVMHQLHREYGHLQEIIIQNFRAKPETRMADAPEPSLEELLWTIAVTRLIFGPEMSVQAPPNLSPGVLGRIVDAGINDWGGVSPVTPDFVNPEAPWPEVEELARQTEQAGKQLLERLTVYPRYALDAERWVDKALRPAVLQQIDASGYARTDRWAPGEELEVPAVERQHLTGPKIATTISPDLASALQAAEAEQPLDERQIVELFAARGHGLRAVCELADAKRHEQIGDDVTYVVNRNINYTNICYFKCQFCAFSKGKMAENLRGKPYDLELPEVQRRVTEAWLRGATEVCMQGGIHPEYTGETYLGIVRAVKEAEPDMHVHAFSPLEIWQGAKTLDLPLDEYLQRLQAAGLGTLPGTAAEILDDEVREVLCADKIRTDQWLEVMEAAHGVGLRTTATIMYGHIERPEHWARHLLRLRNLQERTGGFTEFVPLPFVPMEAPIYLKGRARRGPTFREAVLMHAVSRLVLGPSFRSIQASWVKMGPEGVQLCLDAGANDLGGTLMNESITRAAGASWGQELPPEQMEELIRAAGRQPIQRTTLYGRPGDAQRERSFGAEPLSPIINNRAQRYERAPDAVPKVLIRPGLA